MRPRRPYIDPDTLYVIQDAIETLALVRGICCPLTDPDDPADPGDPGDALHLAGSLALQLDRYLPDLIRQAREHGYSWERINVLLDPFPTP